MHEITATIGLYVNAEKRTWPKAVVRERLAERFACASITWGEGVWHGGWEENVTISIGRDSPEEVIVARQKLIHLGIIFCQEAIYIHGEGVVHMPVFP